MRACSEDGGTKQRICTSRQTSSVTYICGHRLLHIRRKAGESRNTRSPKEAKNFLSRPCEKTANWPSRRTSSATYTCGHRLLDIVRKAGESRNTRTPKEAKNFLSRPCEKKNANLYFKANLFASSGARLRASGAQLKRKFPCQKLATFFRTQNGQRICFNLAARIIYCYVSGALRRQL